MKTTKVPECKRPTANQEYIRKLAKALLLFSTILFLINGCTDSLENALPGSESDPSYYHSTGWKDNPQHGSDYSTNPQNCEACHGEDLEGGASGISCVPCHHSGFSGSPGACQVCHGDYTDSAHGNTTYGVDRLDTGYPTGACTHCHDTGDPNASENELMLFAPYSFASQTDNFCFQCHKEVDSVQAPLFTNYNYSYRASRDSTITCPDDILQAFSFIDESGSSVSNCGSDYGTSHKLTDIKNFIDGRWGYTADSNPCTACHNPHQAQRDTHSDGDRGWPVSRPSGHTDTSTWELWGDDDTERMKQYVIDQGGIYQAPKAVSGYEPDGSDTTDGSNLTDYVTFCTDCHTSVPDSVWSSTLNRWLKPIDWNTEKHGGGAASDDADFIDVLLPYQNDQCSSYILACTDCHEPHGSPNRFLIRESVNNGVVTVTLEQESGVDNTRAWKALCGRCHGETVAAHHRDPAIAFCTDYCHKPNASDKRVCIECHYHGNSSMDGVPYGEPLF